MLRTRNVFFRIREGGDPRFLPEIPFDFSPLQGVR